MDEWLLTHGAERLTEWYTLHNRPLPWRQGATPYRVWVSEIMLQQTRIEAVLPYFDRFMARLPDVAALAAVPEDELMKLWEGLGYYSRARNLQKAARLLCERYGGALPASYEALLTLPGIGEYTAGAIASIAFSIPVPAVDGNVMRVLSRLLADDTDVLSAGAKKHFFRLVEPLVSQREPGRFNQALMELGETVCVPGGGARCGECPLAAGCAARRLGKQAVLPVRGRKKPRRIEKRTVLLAVVDTAAGRRVLLRRRPAKGLLAGLWEPPNILAEEEQAVFRELSAAFEELPLSKHLFSHIEWHMTGRLYRFSEGEALPAIFADCQPVSAEQLEQTHALPSAFRAYAALLPRLLSKEEG